jgi:hypothetical protein
MMRESLPYEASAMELSGASEASDRSIVSSSDDSLSWSDANSLRAWLNIPWVHIDDQATRTTEANPSQYSEESQVCGSASKTVGVEGVGGLKTTGLESDTVSICYCFVLREDVFSH